MDHPAIARVFDAGSTEQGRPYFVMEYVTGVPITDYCDKHKLISGSGWSCSWLCAMASSMRTRRRFCDFAAADGGHDVHAGGGHCRNAGIYEPGIERVRRLMAREAIGWHTSRK